MVFWNSNESDNEKLKFFAETIQAMKLRKIWN